MGRRVFCLILVLMILLSLAACGKISKDKAADIALEKLGLSRITTTRIDTERTAVEGKDAYKVTIYQPYENQIVIVDAQTGEVLSESVEDANRG